MRKLLLAGAAVMGLASAAQAQVGLVTEPKAPGTTGPYAAAQPTPAPGQVAVRMNGSFNWAYGFSANGDIGHNPHWTFANNTWTAGPGGKIASSGMMSYIRLYPGFDGVAANGLKYGVVAEIRQDNAGTPTGSTSGSTPFGATTSPTVAARYRGLMYWRRAYGYIGGDSWGKIQFGSGDGPVSAMGQIGSYGNIGTGNICGDAPSFNATGSGPWPFLGCQGSMYTTNKVVYYSPQIAGFDFGFAYEPGTGNLNATQNCALAGATPGDGTGCDFLSSTTGNDYLRRMNLLDMAVRYRGAFGGVGLAAVGGYLFSGHVTDQLGTHAPVDGLSVGYGGVTVDFAGFSVGGALQGGRQAGIGTLAFTTARDQFAWVVGTTYTTGPVQVGVTYFENVSQGSWTPSNAATVDRTRKDRGFETALNYGIAPGLSATLEYIWTDSQQPGADFVASRFGAQSTVTNQLLVGALHLKW